MTAFQQWLARSLVAGFSTMLLLLVLVACASTVYNSAPTGPLSSPVPSLTLQTYTGTGFTFGYPQGWKLQNKGTAVVVSDPTRENTLTIQLVANPNGKQSASDLAGSHLSTLKRTSVKHAQAIAGLAATVKVGGESWVERGTSGTLNEQGQTFSGNLIVLVDNHPAKSSTTQAYEISYSGLYITFQQVNMTFQAMLQSFKFTS